MSTPTVIQHQASSDAVTLTLKMDAQLDVFKGHFPNFPILPGVAQIDFAVRYARQFLCVMGEFAGMDAIKFQEPILSDATVNLELSWHAEKERLSFRFRSEEGTHSSGRITIKRA